MTDAQIIDGPLVGHPLRIGKVRPYQMCIRTDGSAAFEHYVLTDEGYHHIGSCADLRCNIVAFCDRSWDRSDGRHSCTAIGPHDTHRCCCGAEEQADA